MWLVCLRLAIIYLLFTPFSRCFDMFSLFFSKRYWDIQYMSLYNWLQVHQ